MVFALQNQVVVVKPVGFYCNGMNTTKTSARAAANKLAKGAALPIILHYNKATGPALTHAMMTEAGVAVVAGLGLGLGSMAVKDKKTKQMMQALAIIIPIALITTIAIQYTQIQKAKNQEARVLAERVIKHLESDPKAKALLILHSQGADVGNRALKHHLTAYKDRIDVITIGPAVRIPEERARHVVNIQNKGDVISKCAIAVNELKSSGRKRLHHIVKSECKTGACHGTEDYLEESHVATAIIQHLGRPHCYNTQGMPISCRNFLPI